MRWYVVEQVGSRITIRSFSMPMPPLRHGHSHYAIAAFAADKEAAAAVLQRHDSFASASLRYAAFVLLTLEAAASHGKSAAGTSPPSRQIFLSRHAMITASSCAQPSLLRDTRYSGVVRTQIILPPSRQRRLR